MEPNISNKQTLKGDRIEVGIDLVLVQNAVFSLETFLSLVQVSWPLRESVRRLSMSIISIPYHSSRMSPCLVCVFAHLRWVYVQRGWKMGRGNRNDVAGQREIESVEPVNLPHLIWQGQKEGEFLLGSSRHWAKL